MEELYGIYNEDGNILAVHKTEKGANKNLENYDTWHYVDLVTLHE